MEAINCRRMTPAHWLLLFLLATLLSLCERGGAKSATSPLIATVAAEAEQGPEGREGEEEDEEGVLAGKEDRWNISMRMPDIRPDHGEQYLCMARRVEPGSFIVGFEPHSSAHRVHHMLVYGCQLPGIYQRDSVNFVWDCGSMEAPRSAQESSFERGPACQGAAQILYAWAMDAPALELPAGVGFELGGAREWGRLNAFLVLQLHYGQHADFDNLPELTDNSGLELRLARGGAAIERRAGVLLLSSVGQVAPGRSRHEIWCPISEPVELHPFRFRAHTHGLGVRVLGAKLSSRPRPPAGLALQRAQLIGAADPQRAQTFRPVREPGLVLRQGDLVYAYCDFNNNRSRPVSIGSSGEDEMCNFYLMYWTNGPSLLSYQNCVSKNPRPAQEPAAYSSADFSL